MGPVTSPRTRPAGKPLLPSPGLSLPWTAKEATRSPQVTNEVVHGSELGMPFVPVLHGISHEEFQALAPGAVIGFDLIDTGRTKPGAGTPIGGVAALDT